MTDKRRRGARGLPLFFLFGLLAAGMARDAFSGSDTTPQVTLVVSGTIVQKEEIWDRRSDPLMGRPDLLKEIRLQIASLKVREGRLPSGTATLAVAISGQKQLLSYKSLSLGMSGEFHLAGNAMPYELVSVSSLVKPKVTPKEAPRPKPWTAPTDEGKFPENVRARDLKASEPLRKKVVRAISFQYGMTEAKVVFLTSFSGPMPPDGGYLFWGVTGKIKGKWHIWQAGTKGVRPGSELIDPHRYQK